MRLKNALFKFDSWGHHLCLKNRNQNRCRVIKCDMTEAQYLETCQKVERGKVSIDKVNGWLNPKYKKYVDLYEQWCVAMLHYEIEHDMIPL